MLCSRCGDNIKPVVALDIDGTLANFHHHFCWFADMYLGTYVLGNLLPNHRYDGVESFNSWFCRTWGVGIEVFRQVKLAYRQGGMKRSMPIFDGAYALAGAIQDAGAELWVTTTRPYLSLDNVVPDTVFWLEQHEIEYDYMLFDDDKYGKLVERVDSDRVVLVLDDLWEMWDAAEVLFPGRAMLVCTPWNRAVRRPSMCSLDAAADIAVGLIQDWKEQHA